MRGLFWLGSRPSLGCSPSLELFKIQFPNTCQLLCPASGKWCLSLTPCLCSGWFLQLFVLFFMGQLLGLSIQLGPATVSNRIFGYMNPESHILGKVMCRHSSSNQRPLAQALIPGGRSCSPYIHSCNRDFEHVMGIRPGHRDAAWNESRHSICPCGTDSQGTLCW